VRQAGRRTLPPDGSPSEPRRTPCLAGAAPLACAALLVALGGCCGGGKSGPPADTALNTAVSSGRQSLIYGRPTQSAEQYGRAFTLALARDDAAAIGDVGFDLAVARLAAGDPRGALQSVQRTRAALALRDTPGFAELDLVQAVALHQLGRDGEADSFAARAEQTAGDPQTRAKAATVRGLVAYHRGDAGAVRQALARIDATEAGIRPKPKTPNPDWQADRAELAARLALLEGRPEEAVELALQSADIRRLQLQYRGMDSMLEFAAYAAERAGRPDQAADLRAQANESLHAQQATGTTQPAARRHPAPPATPAPK